MQYIFLRVLMRRIKAIPPFLRDKTVPFRKKLIIVLGIAYLLSPIDLIPAPILLFGIIDDIVVWSFIIYYLKDELDKYWLGEKEVKPEERFHGKKIIDDVKFEVKDETMHWTGNDSAEEKEKQ
ncbi:MAG: DUF1232 domain-containing protein, partial [Clostridiales bacterium]|nr:DUF1232 domain-containing protein [Clostridiales bacterium]